MMKKYSYKEQDITLDIVMKIEKIVRIVSQKTGKTFEQVLSEFYESNTYKALQNTNSVLWAESSQYIVDEFLREWESKIKNSSNLNKIIRT